MTGQHDRQDERLTGQLPNQSGHCPLTGRYFEPCVRVEKCRYTVRITCVYQKCQFRVPMKDFVWPTNFHFALGDKNVFIQLILVRNL